MSRTKKARWTVANSWESRPHKRRPNRLVLAANPAEDIDVVIRGRIEKGVVVLNDNVSLPEGTEVTVVVRGTNEVTEETLSQRRHRRLVDAFQRIAALPIEGSTEPFSGANHDKALYGNP